MEQKNKNNTGVLFNNTYKKTEAQPDLTGSVYINDVEYKLAGWNKVSGKGTEFISLSLKAKEEDISV